jgi:hypothetical protein
MGPRINLLNARTFKALNFLKLVLSPFALVSSEENNRRSGFIV